MRQYKQITWTIRLQIEAMLKLKAPVSRIAKELGYCRQSIYAEIKRGEYERLDSRTFEMVKAYSPDIAEQKYQANLRNKGRPLKIGKDHAFAQYVEYKIGVEKYSPAAVLAEIKNKGLKFDTEVCKQTLYRYIDNGLFLTISNKSLPIKRNRTGKYNKIQRGRAARPPMGQSIEKRPDEINARGTFGHWEMDCVCGPQGSKAALLVLTERYSRFEIVRKLANKTTAAVVHEINELEKKWGAKFTAVFKSITCDNGSEFADCPGLETSINGGRRVQLYYCHPYSSWERGSNENQNRMIRRHYHKGYDFTNEKQSEINKVQKWLNDYPRELLDWRSSAELFNDYVIALDEAC